MDSFITILIAKGYLKAVKRKDRRKKILLLTDEALKIYQQIKP